MSTAVCPTVKPAPAPLVQDRKFIDNSSLATTSNPGAGSSAQMVRQPHEKTVQPTSSVNVPSVQPHSPSLPVQELPKPSNLRGKVLSATSDKLDNDSENVSKAEISLEAEIGHLWTMQLKSTASVRRNRQRVAILKAQLAEQLYHYKRLLVKTGRGGKWTLFLISLDINRASADRWVKMHERSLSPPQTPNRLIEALSGPSHEDIAILVKKLKPKLVSVLTTPDSATRFLSELSRVLNTAIPAS